jgi:hypothetical protein
MELKGFATALRSFENALEQLIGFLNPKHKGSDENAAATVKQKVSDEKAGLTVEWVLPDSILLAMHAAGRTIEKSPTPWSADANGKLFALALPRHIPRMSNTRRNLSILLQGVAVLLLGAGVLAVALFHAGDVLRPAWFRFISESDPDAAQPPPELFDRFRREQEDIAGGDDRGPIRCTLSPWTAGDSHGSNFHSSAGSRPAPSRTLSHKGFSLPQFFRRTSAALSESAEFPGFFACPRNAPHGLANSAGSDKML